MSLLFAVGNVWQFAKYNLLLDFFKEGRWSSNSNKTDLKLMNWGPGENKLLQEYENKGDLQ